MAFRNILLQANSYPEPTPLAAIERSQRVAAILQAKLSMGVCKVHLPPVSNWLANKLIQADQMIAEENRKSAQNAKTLVDAFTSSVEEARRGEQIVLECPAMVTHWALATRARTYDLTIVPAYGHAQTPAMAEGLAFQSGRPVLLLPVDDAPVAFDRVIVGWDGSRVAARALADALPICHLAKSVAVVTVTEEKDLSHNAPASDVLRYLDRHGISAELVAHPAGGHNAGTALQSYRASSGGDLIVMGAFGHSRAREFILGGATRAVLQGTDCPVLLSH